MTYIFSEEKVLGGDRVGWYQCPILDLRGEAFCLLLRIGRNILAHRSIADAIDLQIESGRSVGVLPVFEALDRIVHSRIHALDRAGDYAGMDGMLIAINADAKDAFLIGPVECANAAAAGNLKYDVGLVLVNLAGRNVFALCRVVKGLRIVNDYFYGGIDLLRTVLVAGDVVINGGDRESSHSRNSVLSEQLWYLALSIYLHLSGDGSNQAASLLLFEREGRHVGQRLAVAAVQRCGTAVNDGEILVGILPGYLVYRAVHEEANGDDEVRALRRLRQIAYVVAGRLRLDQLFRVAELFSGRGVPPVGELVKTLVIDAARVGDDGDRLRRFCCSSAATTASAARGATTAATGEQHSKYGDE